MKLNFKNRNSINIAVELDEVESSEGVAFMAHGMGGFKEQPHIIAMAEGFRAAGFTTVRWDAANTLGESGGNVEDTSVTSFYEDLEDAIGWARTQDWFKEPFILSGHSLGGIISILYAEAHPKQIKALVPVSSVIAGKLTLSLWSKEELEDWERTGMREEESISKPGVTKRFKWAFVPDLLKYDVLPKAHTLTMPILLIVGGLDTGTKPEHERMLYDTVSSEDKKLVIIEDAKHNFRTEEELSEVKATIADWAGHV